MWGLTMTDIALPGFARPTRWRPGQPITIAGLVLAALVLFGLALLNWSAVLSDTSRDCRLIRGSFSSGFSSDFDVDRCECPVHSLNFGDSCNSMYVPML
jgi:hypothetical protein